MIVLQEKGGAMANYKRKRPKKYTLNDCGVKHCRYDHNRDYSLNGRDRYVMNQWKQVPYDGKNPWRHKGNDIEISY